MIHGIKFPRAHFLRKWINKSLNDFFKLFKNDFLDLKFYFFNLMSSVFKIWILNSLRAWCCEKGDKIHTLRHFKQRHAAVHVADFEPDKVNVVDIGVVGAEIIWRMRRKRARNWNPIEPELNPVITNSKQIKESFYFSACWKGLSSPILRENNTEHGQFARGHFEEQNHRIWIPARNTET